MPWWIVIGFIILLVLGTLVTLFYLKPECTEGFDTAVTQEIYSVANANGAGMSHFQAATACTVLGGRLALATEVYNAALTGTNWTIPGWIAEDKEYGYSPISAGNEASGVTGPAVVRYRAEVDVDINRNYSATAPNTAICYGFLPSTSVTTAYRIYPATGTFTPISNNNIFDVSGDVEISSLFDTATSYTVLDLDALHTQKNIITVDMENENKILYDSESALLNNLVKNDNFLSMNDNDAKKRFQVGYKLGMYHIELLQTLSMVYSSIPFMSDPYYNLVTKFSQMPLTFDAYKRVLLDNINSYYSDIIGKLNSFPLGYITSGVLNSPSYLNSFGIIPAPTTWEYYIATATPANTSDIYYEIHRRRGPPHSNCDANVYYLNIYIPGPMGCRMIEYKNVPTDNAWQGRNADTALQHFPGGNWWRDKKGLTSRDGLLVCDAPWNKPAWDAFHCYWEYPALDNKITARDLRFTKTINRAAYPTNFLLSSATWVPTASTPDGLALLNRFKADKETIATTYGITSQDKYRWKPITYVGVISSLNKKEVKKSTVLASFFKFEVGLNVEYHIRISSTPPFKLYFSKNANAKPEFVETVIPGSISASPDADLIKNLTIASMVIGSAAAVGTAAGSLARTGSTLARAGTYGGLTVGLGAAAMQGAAIGIAATSGNINLPNLHIAASNADYNDITCTPFNLELFNLLPYHARQFISVWAMLRKSRIIEWYINSVYRPTSDSKNPPGGPYQGSPLAAAKSTATNLILTVSAAAAATTATSITVGDLVVNDTSGNIFGSGTGYKLSESLTINSIQPIELRKKVYDAMAQAYYNLNNGEAKIINIIDVYQVGTTLYDVRFTESRRSGSLGFKTKIDELNLKYNAYRYQKLSDSQLNNLETSYSTAIKNLYDKENKNLFDSARDCGVSAQFVKISRTGSPFNMSQVIVLNNFGQNVAYLKKATVSSPTALPTTQITYLAGYEDKRGNVYYDSLFNPYSAEESAKLAVRDNSGTVLAKLAILTDGTYTKRYNSFYKTVDTVNDAYILIDLTKAFDISVVTILYSPALVGGIFNVELLSSSMETVGTSKPFTCNDKGSSTVSFVRPGRNDDPNLPSCPTDIYSMYKIARFFASSPTVASGSANVSPLTFTAYAEGIDAATTFNPLYNTGIPLNTTSSYGNINYKPKTVFNANLNTISSILDCNNPLRIRNVFKDHLLHVNGSEFKNRADIRGLITPYSNSYLYRPVTVTAVANASADKYKCAYKWKENVYNASDGSIVPAGTTISDGNTTTLDSAGQIERYGIFNYTYDTENWVSRGVIFNLLSSVQFSSEAQLTSTLTGTSGSGVVTAITQSLYIPYWDSLKLANNNGQCPETDCMDPDVINSIITSYNEDSAILKENRILRVTKALTTAKDKCEYEFTTSSILKTVKSFQVTPDAECKYKINRPTKEEDPAQRLRVTSSLYISSDTPLLAKAYNYASESIKPYIDTMSSIYSEVYNTYLQPQIDSYSDGILGDLIRYRATTNTAGGQIRNVSNVGQPVLNEAGDTCTTICNSPEIKQSFFTYYNNYGDEKVTQIQNLGMDASGNCDFTYESKAVNFTNGVGTLGNATTRGSKFKIERYPNSCAYRVTGQPVTIMPVPNLSSIMNFSTIDLFNPAVSLDTSKFNPITAAAINSLAASGTNPAVGINGPSGVPSGNPSGVPLKPRDSPFLQPASVNLLEMIDYVDCLSKYAINSIYNLGMNDSVSGIQQVDAKTCAINTVNGKRQYSFIRQTSVVGVAASLVIDPNSQTTTSIDIPVLTPPININTFATLTCNPAVNCETAKAITGFSASVVGSIPISNDTCEYKITTKSDLPFENTFQRVSFYTGKSVKGVGTDADLHIKSITNSIPATSPYAYFKNANIKPSFISDYMKLLQLIRYTWNSQFYIQMPTNTSYWKIANITGIGILANEDAVVFEAKSCLYGIYGPYDIRDYSDKRYFKFTLRINDENGIDSNNYTVTPYTINNINIYKKEDSATPFPGGYRSNSFFTVTDEQYNLISTYLGFNYNAPYFDLDPGLNPKPSNPPPATYIVQTIDKALQAGYYNRVRLTVTAIPSGTPPQDRAEFTRIMFYDSSLDSNFNTVYNYEEITNASVEIEGILSNYLLIERGATVCDPGYIQIIDPETKMRQCIYVGDGSQQYDSATPCASSDTTISVPASPSGSQMYRCSKASTYQKPLGVACGIGYFGSTDNSTSCTLLGNFELVTQNPSYMFNANQAVPRLRVPLNKKLTIYFNKT